MGVATSKSSLIQDVPARAPKGSATAATERGVALKRSKTRTPNLRIEDCFGLDESQSRATESTQGSPEIDMYPTKESRGARRTSWSSTAGRSTWFRRQASSSSGVAAPVPRKNKDPLPPSYLVFEQPEKLDSSKSYSPSSASGKTAPVPVTRTSQSVKQMGGWETCSDLGDPEERMDELQRMYDMRTWDMYLRITEARKNKPVAPANNTMIPHHQHHKSKDDYDYFTPGEDTFDEPDVVDVSQSEEMIFGDLE